MNAKQFERKINAIRKRYENAFREIVQVTKTPRFLNPIAEIIAERVRIRTRLGYGVDREGGEKKKLKALSPKYIDYRKKNKAILYNQTTPRKSNLTFSGQLLDSISGRSNPRGIVIYLKDRRNDGKKNVDIKNYQEEKGRPFFYLTRQEIVNTEREYRQRVYAEMKKRIISLQ